MLVLSFKMYYKLTYLQFIKTNELSGDTSQQCKSRDKKKNRLRLNAAESLKPYNSIKTKNLILFSMMNGFFLCFIFNSCTIYKMLKQFHVHSFSILFKKQALSFLNRPFTALIASLVTGMSKSFVMSISGMSAVGFSPAFLS